VAAAPGQDLQDKPLGLAADCWTAYDDLEREDFQRVLTSIVLGARTPFVVAVYGAWGSGKTSLMKTVGRSLHGDVEHSRRRKVVKKVWFDLWQHQDDAEPVVALLQTARDVMYADPDGAGGRRRAFNQVTRHLKTIVRVLGSAKVDVGRGSANVSVGEYHTGWTAVGRERFELQERRVRLRQEFSRVIDLFLGRPSPKKRRGPDVDYVKGVWQEPTVKAEDPAAKADESRVVFFIDNLDRCRPDVAVDLLEKMQTFLTLPGCVFVLGLDETAIRRTIRHRFEWFDKEGGKAGDDSDRLDDHYLEKIIQYAFRLPPLRVSDYWGFTNNLLDREHHLQLTPSVGRDQWEPPADHEAEIVPLSVLSIALEERHASLRLAKSTVNAFRVNHRLGQVRLKESYNEVVMAVVTALQQLHTDVYDVVCRDSARRADRLGFLFDGGSAGPAERPGAEAAAEAPELAVEREPFGVDHHGQSRLAGSRRLLTLARRLWAETDARELRRLRRTLSQYVELAGQAAVVREPEVVLTRLADPPRADPLPEELLERYRIEGGDLAATRKGLRAGDRELVTVGAYVWRVLHRDLEADRVLLLSEYPVAIGPFHERFEAVTWQRSSLRRWLNTEFRDAFVSSLGVDVGEVIVPELVCNGPNPARDTQGDDRPQLDHVFLLSREEAAKCMARDNSTGWPRYQSHLRLTDASGTPCWWWLRSHGFGPGLAAAVDQGGVVDGVGISVSSDSGAVRPALWLKLGS
jgi:hypothetical protein